MITADRAPRRPVHMIGYRGLVACGAHRPALLAITADNADAPRLVTCPLCRRTAPRNCRIWVVGSI